MGSLEPAWEPDVDDLPDEVVVDFDQPEECLRVILMKVLMELRTTNALLNKLTQQDALMSRRTIDVE